MKGDFWKNRVLIGILILALIVRIFFIYNFPVRWWDETVYSDLGYELSRGNSYSFKQGWSDFVPGGYGKYAWPRAGFRAPLLPFLLMFFYLFKLEFLIDFLVPLIGTLGIFAVYLLGKELFNKRIGLYSAFFLALLPLHVFYSGRILTGVLSTTLITFSFLFFWRGFEKGSNKYKLLFGFFIALSLLSRYTVLWVFPVFLIYFLVRFRLKFLEDKYLWYSGLIFLLTLSHWFLYGIIEYGDPLGAFIHGAKAASYWGGIQSWAFFFQHSWGMFSLISYLFLIALVYIIIRRKFLKKEFYLLLVWLVFFLFMVVMMPHKEDRFILPITPVLCIFSGVFVYKFKYKRILLVFLGAFLLVVLGSNFYHDFSSTYTDSNFCFLEGTRFLKRVNMDSLVITDLPPTIYYYSKKDTHYYPNPFSIEALKPLKQDYLNMYVFFTDSNMPLYIEDYKNIRGQLDSSLEIVFDCKNKSRIYKY